MGNKLNSLLRHEFLRTKQWKHVEKDDCPDQYLTYARIYRFSDFYRHRILQCQLTTWILLLDINLFYNTYIF